MSPATPVIAAHNSTRSTRAARIVQASGRQAKWELYWSPFSREVESVSRSLARTPLSPPPPSYRRRPTYVRGGIRYYIRSVGRSVGRSNVAGRANVACRRARSLAGGRSRRCMRGGREREGGREEEVDTCMSRAAWAKDTSSVSQSVGRSRTENGAIGNNGQFSLVYVGQKSTSSSGLVL